MLTTTTIAAAGLLLPLLAPAEANPASPAIAAISATAPRDEAVRHAVFDLVIRRTKIDEALAAPDPAPTPAPATYGDPYGFAAMINNYRASAGLPPLSYDPNLAAWASQNNAAQCSRGLGHHILPNCFQNCGWNQSTVWSIFQSWTTSPAHARNMLAPSATRYGIAFGPGPYWTMNAQ